MEDILIAIDRAIQKNESLAAITPEFHCALAEASHNAVLTKLLRSFTQLMAKAGRLLEESVEDLDKFKRDELKSHQNLFHVIKQRDPEKSRKAMLDHIAESEKLIVAALKRAEEVESSALEAPTLLFKSHADRHTLIEPLARIPPSHTTCEPVI